MQTPATKNSTSTTTDEFDIDLDLDLDLDIDLEDARLAEAPANHRPTQEVIVLVPDGVSYTLERQSQPGALSLRILVEVSR